MIVSLIGMPGSGKSTVGRILATRMGETFIDLDRYIERRQCRCISEIFAAEGETAFRGIEYENLKEIIDSEEDIVLALGGGTVTRQDCAQLVREHTFCVRLTASLPTLMKRIGSGRTRPLLCGQQNPSEVLERLMAERESCYVSAARFAVFTDDLSAAEVADRIYSQLFM